MTSTKVAIVTAASRGMGAAIARELGGRGYALALLARSDEVRALGEELKALVVRGSVVEAADLEALVRQAHERHGRIDVVVNNTGHVAKGELLAISDAEWAHGLEMILLNVIRMARLATPIMLAQGCGCFINISSYSAKQPDLRFPVSSTLRAGLGNFAQLYAGRYAKDGLRMNNVLPGFIDSHPVNDDVLRTIPAGRAGRVEEIAKAVAYLASDDAGYINGQSLLVDGGLVRTG